MSYWVSGAAGLLALRNQLSESALEGMSYQVSGAAFNRIYRVPKAGYQMALLTYYWFFTNRVATIGEEKTFLAMRCAV